DRRKSEKSASTRSENAGKLKVSGTSYILLSYLMRFISLFLMADSLVSPLNKLSNGRGLGCINLVKLLGRQQTYYVYAWMFASLMIMFLICYVLYRKKSVKNK
ncbi:hypothetical protein, partial [Vibrio parahaemolyticus]|uniref:hypothetical protein n=1 Tax=Vibrio parahaemolyticus TaxID=670 RepID=UPI00235DF4C6